MENGPSVPSLPVDVTQAVFMIGAQTPEGWDFLFERYRTSLQSSTKSRLKVAMAFSPLQDKLAWWVQQVTPPQASPTFGKHSSLF